MRRSRSFDRPLRAALTLAVSLASAALLAIAASACGPASATDPVPAEGDAGTCATCHMEDFRAAKHHLGEKPTTCAICHAQTGFHPTHMNHPWPLTGAHEKTNCFDCHKGTPPVFAGTKRECVACHQADYDKAPHHVAEHYPTTCADCHSTTAFKPQLPEAEAAWQKQKAAATLAATTSATPPPDEPPAPNGKPTVKPKPKPRPTPKPTPTPTPVPPPPDVHTGPSGR